MTLIEVANALVAGCREGRERENLETLYAEDAVSVEAMAMPGQDSAEIHGRDGIRGKHDWWDSAMEMHSAEIEGPYLHGDDRFAVCFKVDATDKASGERSLMEEVAIYHVKDGRIVREEFFYNMP
ncbi:SnoaL-like domain-containing protein [Roseivivax lentus]|uniref:SnoaL-like domain-containing protein n=1 Tax=Roseivivax lentus TaxID=633194 RepID=A0A1N7LAG4_9RHOB|nr:nuclear transport factor 2 family protein [Roseivivax lentus]SIS70751.1 SnoaL-like domain-containing protein [Roseivivax lentus]